MSKINKKDTSDSVLEIMMNKFKTDVYLKILSLDGRVGLRGSNCKVGDIVKITDQTVFCGHLNVDVTNIKNGKTYRYRVYESGNFTYKEEWVEIIKNNTDDTDDLKTADFVFTPNSTKDKYVSNRIAHCWMQAIKDSRSKKFNVVIHSHGKSYYNAIADANDMFDVCLQLEHNHNPLYNISTDVWPNGFTVTYKDYIEDDIEDNIGLKAASPKKLFEEVTLPKVTIPKKFKPEFFIY